jgi:hypothetical protein
MKLNREKCTGAFDTRKRATGVAALLAGLGAGVAWGQVLPPATTWGGPRCWATELAPETHLRFDPAGPAEEDGWLRLDGGRVLLRPVTWPDMAVGTTAQVRLTLRSAGDPWDKSGTVFVLPADQGPAWIEASRQGTPGPDVPVPVELLRFITPFGVGHFNDRPRVDSIRPVYIPSWAEEVVWQADITHLHAWMGSEAWLGVYIDTWSDKGWTFELSHHHTEPPFPLQDAPAPPSVQVVPLALTTRLLPGASDATFFPDRPLEVEFALPEGVQEAALFATVTGHGGHEGGDEFTPQPQACQIDGVEVGRWVPWREDCAGFRRFNPSSGVWSIPHPKMPAGTTERIASSDLPRSNWCPGSHVAPFIVELGALTPGTHRLQWTIPGAQRATENEHNFWNVGLYLVYRNASP